MVLELWYARMVTFFWLMVSFLSFHRADAIAQQRIRFAAVEISISALYFFSHFFFSSCSSRAYASLAARINFIVMI